MHLHGLLNAFSTLQKVTFPNWKTCFFGIQESRSANHANTNRNHMLFCRKLKTACLFHLYLHGLLNVFPTLQNVMFSNQETLFSAKWKTRSANHANTNEKGKPFDVFCKITYDPCLYLHGLLNAFPTLQSVKFSHEETSLFRKVENAFSKSCKYKQKPYVILQKT